MSQEAHHSVDSLCGQPVPAEGEKLSLCASCFAKSLRFAAVKAITAEGSSYTSPSRPPRMILDLAMELGMDLAALCRHPHLVISLEGYLNGTCAYATAVGLCNRDDTVAGTVWDPSLKQPENTGAYLEYLGLPRILPEPDAWPQLESMRKHFRTPRRVGHPQESHPSPGHNVGSPSYGSVILTSLEDPFVTSVSRAESTRSGPVMRLQGLTNNITRRLSGRRGGLSKLPAWHNTPRSSPVTPTPASRGNPSPKLQGGDTRRAPWKLFGRGVLGRIQQVGKQCAETLKGPK